MLIGKSRTQPWFTWLSPIGIFALGYFTARWAGDAIGVWAWLPLTLVLWTSFAVFIKFNGGLTSIRRWLRPPTGAAGWSMLALAVGLSPLPLFILNWHTLGPVWVWLPWLIFALINPVLEEGYWRGVLLDATAHWPGWLGVVYTSLVFALNHPLTFGVNSIANRHPATVISTFVMGLAWATVYRKTKSLRFAVLAHVLVDLFNLSIAAFLNLYIPPGLPIR